MEAPACSVYRAIETNGIVGLFAGWPNGVRTQSKSTAESKLVVLFMQIALTPRARRGRENILARRPCGSFSLPEIGTHCMRLLTRVPPPT
eukprot:12424131-Karenia_brevis.AAC.1